MMSQLELEDQTDTVLDDPKPVVDEISDDFIMVLTPKFSFIIAHCSVLFA